MAKKKKNSKSVVAAIIITLIVLAGLTFAGIKYILPNYFQSSDDAQFEIYKFAVKIFPLLVGVVLIVIASMIATSRDDEEDEDDKLPPNSYDRQLFEAPADDPSLQKVKQEEKAPEAASEVTPEEEKQFISIFDTPAAEAPAEEAEDAAEPSAEEEPVAEVAEEPQAAKAPVAAAVVAAPAPASAGSSDKLVDAIYALVNKLDNMADVITYDEDFDDEDYEEYEDEEAPAPAAAADNSALEAKVDKLCDAVATLASIIGSQAVAQNVAPAAPAAAPAPAAEPAPVEEKQEEPEAEAPAVEEAPAAQAAPSAHEPIVETKTVEVEVEVDKVINDVDANDPVQRARVEFDSAKDGFYDISYAFTSAPLSEVQLALGDFGDAYEVNGKTVVIVPFLSKDEAVDELDKLEVPYDIVTVPAGSDEDFDSAIAPKLQ